MNRSLVSSMLLVVLLAQAGCSKSPTSNPSLIYWNSLNKIIQTTPVGFAADVSKSSDKSRPREVSDAQTALKAIESLPVVGVDADVIQCGLSLTNLLRTKLAFWNRYGDSAFVDTMLATLISGDANTVTNAVDAVRADSGKVSEIGRAWISDAAKTRVALAARYGVEVPAIHSLVK